MTDAPHGIVKATPADLMEDTGSGLDYGIRPSLSSDVDVTMAQDPFTVMRHTLNLQRLMLLQRMQKSEGKKS